MSEKQENIKIVLFIAAILAVPLILTGLAWYLVYKLAEMFSHFSFVEPQDQTAMLWLFFIMLGATVGIILTGIIWGVFAAIISALD